MRNLIACLLPLPDKKTMTAVDSIKRADWTSYQKSFNKVLSFVVMCASEDFLHLMTAMYEIISVCMCVKQQTDKL